MLFFTWSMFFAAWGERLIQNCFAIFMTVSILWSGRSVFRRCVFIWPQNISIGFKFEWYDESLRSFAIIRYALDAMWQISFTTSRSNLWSLIASFIKLFKPSTRISVFFTNTLLSMNQSRVNFSMPWKCAQLILCIRTPLNSFPVKIRSLVHFRFNTFTPSLNQVIIFRVRMRAINSPNKIIKNFYPFLDKTKRIGSERNRTCGPKLFNLPDRTGWTVFFLVTCFTFFVT
jgi:hypothetical protein